MHFRNNRRRCFTRWKGRRRFNGSFTAVAVRIRFRCPRGRNAAPKDCHNIMLRIKFFTHKICCLLIEKIANGILYGTQTNAHLTAMECYELGKFAQESAYFTLALQWFDVTLQRLEAKDFKGDPSLSSIKKDLVMKAIRATIEEVSRNIF